MVFEKEFQSGKVDQLSGKTAIPLYANGANTLFAFSGCQCEGKETDQDTLLRYLAEIVWFPSAALSPYITWQEIDATTARATMSYGGITASGGFKFNPEGDVNSFEARRYCDRKKATTPGTWFIAIDGTAIGSLK